MVDRQEVEDLLADATHPHSYMERVPADTLAALCRAWLAVNQAEAVTVRSQFGDAIVARVAADYKGQRVRIVKEISDE